MENEKIYLQRIRNLLGRIKPQIYPEKVPLEASFIYDKENPIPLNEIDKKEFKLIYKDEVWGQTWGSAWFKFTATVPDKWAGKEIGLLVNVDGEACLFVNGYPYQGLTNTVDWFHKAAKTFIPLSKQAMAGEKYELLIETAANGLFGADKKEYRLKEADLVIFDSELFQIQMDMEVLLNLAEHLPENSVRRKKILAGLNRAANLWGDGSHRGEIREVLRELLTKPAHASALTAYSIGHAHIDLAWLWRTRETRRKGGRTFATALRMLEIYPQYVFGASQAQLYKWIKQDYPQLYEEIKQAVKQGRWEIQGAGWVEFDTNITGGESIIRQMLYGRRFFQKEFGITPDVLWLPDCFGFSGNLPQLMQGCGVQYFMTQKLSWNETNTFPHHLFKWHGIDGQCVLAHCLPTNDYNCSNNPEALRKAEERYAQADVSDEFLNLYGIGDGGGGPSFEHIEYGLRMQDLEGVPKFKFAFAQEFFEKVRSIDKKLLPNWYGEMYLEFHRGTYTTQALMKKNNRISERLLHDAEFLSALINDYYSQELTQIWEDTLLLQFHDILPGSSIGAVYQDAHQMSSTNHQRLQSFISNMLNKLVDSIPSSKVDANAYVFFNTQGWERNEWIELPEGKWIRLSVPACGYTSLRISEDNELSEQPRLTYTGFLENEFFKIEMDCDGSIKSIYDKENGREVCKGNSNVLRLWEDEPNNWGAWDINHFYRETTPAFPAHVVLLEEESFIIPEVVSCVVHLISLGKSTIIQKTELRAGERLIRISHEVDWQEHHKMLRTSFNLDINAKYATYEIQFGVVKRPVLQNTSWEKAMFEVPAQRFADLSQADYGVALINDCKYGYRIVEHEMELTLLRSPADVDPEADIHKHQYSYALLPHSEDFEHSDVVKQAHCFNSPLLAHPSNKAIEIASHSFVTIDSDSVVLETVKPAEVDNGIVLRLYESKGKKSACRIWVHFAFQDAFSCNMLEEKQEPIPVSISDDLITRYIDLTLEPFKVITLLLKKDSVMLAELEK